MARDTLVRAWGPSLTAHGPHAEWRSGLPGNSQGGLDGHQQAMKCQCVPAAGQGQAAPLLASVSMLGGNRLPLKFLGLCPVLLYNLGYLTFVLLAATTRPGAWSQERRLYRRAQDGAQLA